MLTLIHRNLLFFYLCLTTLLKHPLLSRHLFLTVIDYVAYLLIPGHLELFVLSFGITPSGFIALNGLIHQGSHAAFDFEHVIDVLFSVLLAVLSLVLLIAAF